MSKRSFSDQQVVNSYVYLLGRYLVLRQEHIDLKEDGVDYNVIKYNPVGSADFVNPNLDVAYLEAWIAVDHDTPAILTVPEIIGRYYTAQILDEWGEVIVNINERNFPDHPHGAFTLYAPGSKPELADEVILVELHSNKSKLLARVELKDDWDGAVEMQKQFTLKSTGAPEISPPPKINMFDNKELAGVEIFDDVNTVLETAADVSPVAAEQAAMARQISAYIGQGDAARAEIHGIIRKTAVPQFLRFAVTEAGSFQNNWLATLTVGNYGEAYWTRTAANLVGIWANSSDEVIYFVGTRDADGNPLDGGQTYQMHFPANQGPDAVVESYWSIILVSLPDYRVVPNPDDRFNLNSYSILQTNEDGSLDLYFSPERTEDIVERNWLPTPRGAMFSLTLRTYVPKDVVKRGQWFPPPVKKIK
jgi:hypothetical protein